jgi:hypothetical protein
MACAWRKAEHPDWHCHSNNGNGHLHRKPRLSDWKVLETTILKMNHKIDPILFHTTDWRSIPVTEHQGTTGTARWQTIQFGQLRMRLVEYSKNYRAGRWCKAGRILYCLDGEMNIELSDGRVFKLNKGMSYEVMDGTFEHRLYSESGVTALIMDGPFLKPAKHNFNPWKM